MFVTGPEMQIEHGVISKQVGDGARLLFFQSPKQRKHKVLESPNLKDVKAITCITSSNKKASLHTAKVLGCQVHMVVKENSPILNPRVPGLQRLKRILRESAGI